MAFRLEAADNGGGSQARIGATLSEINIIPLVDVILVLLLIFMLTAPLMHRGVDVSLPKSAAKPTTIEERMVLTLTKDQAVFLNDKPVPVAALDQRLREALKDRSDKTLYLKADQGLQYGFVVETMDRLRRAGVEKLGMVTEPAKER
jgi:biopolymer transport protein TolR